MPVGQILKAGAIPIILGGMTLFQFQFFAPLNLSSLSIFCS